jgi:hypothetical protein
MPAKRTPKPRAKKKSKALKQAEKASAMRRERAAAKTRVFELLEQGWKQVKIADEIGIPVSRVRTWVRSAGLSNTRVPKPPQEPAPPEPEPIGPVEHRILARQQERADISAVSDSHSTPADQYQAFMASSAIKLLRDDIEKVRGPRTVRELSELDQLIRRSLGLNPKGGSGAGGGLQIDISILNGTKAVRGAVVVDAEPYEEEDEDE